jgi:hypothetical protein
MFHNLNFSAGTGVAPYPFSCKQMYGRGHPALTLGEETSPLQNLTLIYLFYGITEKKQQKIERYFLNI